MLAACTVLLPASASTASTPATAAATAPDPVATLPLAQSNWFSRTQPSTVAGTGVAPPASAPDPSVPAGDLVVAGPTTTTPDPANPSANVTGPEKESYLQFDLSSLPTGATITGLTVSLPLDPKAQQGFVPNQPPPVVACAVTGSWAGGDGDESFAGKPADDCSLKVPRKAAADGKTFSFDIAAIAARWTSSTGFNNGFALTDDPANTQTAYQVVFGPITGLTATATYQVPAVTTATQPGDGSGSTLPTSPGAEQSVFPPAPPPLTGTVTLPVTTGGQPPVAAPQVAAPPAAGQPRLQPVAEASLHPPVAAWVAAAALAAVLVLVSLVLGDPSPRRAGRGPRRVLHTLDRRGAVPEPLFRSEP